MSQERNDKNKKVKGYHGEHAVVIGGSVAGMLAARVLSEHFLEVTIFERDKLPKKYENRKGVPQGKQTHAILKGGSDIIKDLFPDIWTEMLHNGSTLTDTGEDWVWFHHDVWKARPKTNLPFYFQSRPFLESHIRDRLLKEYPNVKIIEQAAVRSLINDASQKKVIGVTYEQSSSRGKRVQKHIHSDIVIDASGRGTRTPRWLEDMGYGKVPEEHVKIDICYSSRLYKPPQNIKRDWQVMLIYGKAPDKKIGYISPIEGDRWMVTLAGYHGDAPPTDPKGFLNFAKDLARPEYYEALKGAKPLTDVWSHKLPSDYRRYYEKMRNFPDGLVVMGDAVCSFNPIFGQGMTTAAMGSKNLKNCLERQNPKHLKGLSRRFQKGTASYNNIAWLLSTTEDMRYKETEAKRQFILPVLNWYKGVLLELSSQDENVATRFLQVMHFQKGLEAIAHPMVIFKAIKWALGFKGKLKPERKPGIIKKTTQTRKKRSTLKKIKTPTGATA